MQYIAEKCFSFIYNVACQQNWIENYYTLFKGFFFVSQWKHSENFLYSFNIFLFRLTRKNTIYYTFYFYFLNFFYLQNSWRFICKEVGSLYTAKTLKISKTFFWKLRCVLYKRVRVTPQHPVTIFCNLVVLNKKNFEIVWHPTAVKNVITQKSFIFYFILTFTKANTQYIIFMDGEFVTYV